MKELRQARGLSQARLAKLSGVSERTVRAIELGGVERPQHESLRRIAAVLAYGDSHAQRLVERWTGSTMQRTPQQIGVPGWESSTSGSAPACPRTADRSRRRSPR